MPERKHNNAPAGCRRSTIPDPGWVGTQFTILAVGIAGGLIEYVVTGRGFLLVSTVIAGVVAGLAMLLAVVVLFRAARDLSTNLTASPTPVEGGTLVEHGIYGVVRHPMYASLLAGMLGYTVLLGSWVALAVTLVLIPFFAAKSRHEERLLRARYPGYASYASRVRWRFIPGLV